MSNAGTSKAIDAEHATLGRNTDADPGTIIGYAYDEEVGPAVVGRRGHHPCRHHHPRGRRDRA